MDDFRTFLQEALAGSLPGRAAQQRMMPRYPDGSVRHFPIPDNARQTAVAVVISSPTCPAVLLTLRSQFLRHHRGQISFPGGRIERGEHAIEAALRELQEEVGISSSTVRVLGCLSPLYTPPSNSAITPVVMACNGSVTLCLDVCEVEEAFWVPLHQLDGTAIEQVWELPYGTMIVPHWQVHPRVPLWGATAIILAELLELYRCWLSRQAVQEEQAAGALHRAGREDQPER